ncbi:BacA, bacteroid development protein [Devosia sp. LC5]|uniref:peptide antibiotic transporter SbmA n=1 Tax=Devosia sp. LC5 TaxID=1502724 RepID=UPI0004E3EABF|nr:peptide antibiotic transporter SbmA [Devosia sp. LC5]KFC69176.1 BacA, bacteroid development protein [Devosia sp. LC5]
MFRSFFPEPKIFFPSAILWIGVAMAIWFLAGDALANAISLGPWLGTAPTEAVPDPFLSPEKIWLYQYVLMTGYSFCLFWYVYRRHYWYWWSVFGTVTILEITYFTVQWDAWSNGWNGIFFDLLQRGSSNPGTVTFDQIAEQTYVYAAVMAPYILLIVTLSFFTSHYVFRWRRAMTFYYMSQWQRLRHIEGASQRVQEDTMRLAQILEGLLVAFFDSMMVLVVFLPLLYGLSANITTIPVIGNVDGALVWVALVLAAFGTALLAAVGYKLPGLQFHNQRVEAALRKELVYGEDNGERAEPVSVRQLFAGVQKNYFRLYWHYTYFNLARYSYGNVASILPMLVMAPSLVAGAMTMGTYQQVVLAFNRVSGSFQFLVTAWPTIVELLSVHKRLKAFESHIPPDAPLVVDADLPDHPRPHEEVVDVGTPSMPNNP